MGVFFISLIGTVYADIDELESFLIDAQNLSPNWQLSEITLQSDLEISGLSEKSSAAIRQYAISDETNPELLLVSTLSVFEFSSPSTALEMLQRNADELIKNDVFILDVTIPDNPNCFGVIANPESLNEITVISCANDNFVVIALSEQNGVIHEDSNPISTTNISASFVNFVIQNIIDSKNSQTIPDWIKNNAKWWSEDSIDDETFIQGIQFLIKEGIIDIPVSQNSFATSSEQIPQWIKTNAGWWADGKINDASFVSGIEFMIKQGIIKL